MVTPIKAWKEMVTPIKVWKEKPGKPYQNMWIGRCRICGSKGQYWDWGATLGAMLHHYWKAHCD